MSVNKPSNELQLQLDRYQKQGYYKVNQRVKREIKQLTAELGLEPYNNFGCGTCTRDAMQRLINFFAQKDSTPVLQMNMVKNLDELSWHELKAHAKAKGVKTHKKNREQITKELNADV